MKYRIERTTQFKKDFKLAEKQGMDMTKLADVVRILADGEMSQESILIMNYRGNIRDTENAILSLTGCCSTRSQRVCWCYRL